MAGAIGDQQAALFAQGCFEQGTAKNTYGTGSFVLMNTGRDQITDQQVLLRTIAYGLEGRPVEYALEGSILVTGSAVQWLRDELGIIDNAAETEALAASLDSNDDVWFVPALAGLGAPHWDPAARGVLIGLTRGTTRAHVARAVLESIAWSTKDVIDAMQRESGVHLDELRVDGGATANRWLMQFQSDVLNLPLDVPDNTETTALGSGYLAGLATGVYADRDELAQLRRTAVRYEPRMDVVHPTPAARALDRGRESRTSLVARGRHDRYSRVVRPPWSRCTSVPKPGSPPSSGWKARPSTSSSSAAAWSAPAARSTPRPAGCRPRCSRRATGRPAPAAAPAS